MLAKNFFFLKFILIFFSIYLGLFSFFFQASFGKKEKKLPRYLGVNLGQTNFGCDEHEINVVGVSAFLEAGLELLELVSLHLG